MLATIITTADVDTTTARLLLADLDATSPANAHAEAQRSLIAAERMAYRARCVEREAAVDAYWDMHREGLLDTAQYSAAVREARAEVTARPLHSPELAELAHLV